MLEPVFQESAGDARVTESQILDEMLAVYLKSQSQNSFTAKFNQRKLESISSDHALNWNYFFVNLSVN